MTPLSLFGTIFLVVIGQSLAFQTYTSGSGGDQCGNDTCLKDEASCVDNECKCYDDYGNGVLNCYKTSEFRAEVTNDPEIRDYNNNSFQLPIPCRYLLTHVVSEYKDQGRNVVGACESMVHVFHKKKFGKFYVAGYDIAIRVECNNGSRYEMSFRKYGEADDGNYDFTVLGTDGSFLPHGPFANDNIDFHDAKTNLRIRCKIDENNNLAIIKVKKCGFRIRFRPYDVTARRNQRQLPGVAVGVNCAYHPEFDSVDRVLALPPVWAHNGFTIHSIMKPGLGKMGTMMHRAYMSGIPQTQPDPNPACSGAKDALAQCSHIGQLYMAFKNCVWILRSPRFIRCFDKSDSGFYIQSLFNTCVDIYCSGTSTCNEVLFLMDQQGCLGVPRYPEISTFITDCI